MQLDDECYHGKSPYPVWIRQKKTIWKLAVLQCVIYTNMRGTPNQVVCAISSELYTVKTVQRSAYMVGTAAHGLWCVLTIGSAYGA